MRIVIITTRPFHLVHLGRELAELGHQVTVFGYVPYPRIQYYRPGSALYKSAFLPLLPHTAFAVLRGSYSIQRRATERLLGSIDDYVSKKLPECDVAIALSSVGIESLQIARERFGAITVCDRGSAHVIAQKKVLSIRKASALTDHYVRRELASYEAADIVAVPSIYARNSFVENGYDINRIFRNNYGVDLRRFFVKSRSKPKGDVVKLLYVGGWTFQKGCDVLAEAVRRNRKLHVTHAGQRGDLEFPRSSRFQSRGHVANEKLVELYSTHDVLVLPSRQDGFGMVLLEALACGTPVVASMNTGALDLRQAIENPCAIEVLNEINADALLNAIDLLLERRLAEPSLLTEADKSYFSWAAYGRRYHDFLLDKVSLK